MSVLGGVLLSGSNFSKKSLYKSKLSLEKSGDESLSLLEQELEVSPT